MPMRPVEGLPGGLWKPAGGLQRPGGRTIGIQAGQLVAYWMPVTYWRTMEASRSVGGLWRHMEANEGPLEAYWRPMEAF